MGGIVEWIRYIENAGYINYTEFLQLPQYLVDAVAVIRLAESVKTLEEKKVLVKDTKTKLEIQKNITNIKNIIHGRK